MLLGNKPRYGSHLGKLDNQFGNTIRLIFRQTDNLVMSRSLGQVTHGGFPTVEIDVAIAFDGDDECPTVAVDQIKQFTTGIPGVHKDSNRRAKRFSRPAYNIRGNFNLGTEYFRRDTFTGTVFDDLPRPCLPAGSHNGRNGTQPFDDSLGAVVLSQPVDLFAFARGMGYHREPTAPFAL